MERTLSMNYPVLRQNKRVLLYTFVKNHSLYYFFVYIPSIYPFLPPVLMYSDEIYDSGFLRTYSIIHAYFALVQGSSH